MKAFKIAATALICLLLLAAGLAAESLALLRHTALDPGFYAVAGRDAYGLIGTTVVRKMSEAVLENAPAVALRTTDRGQAYQIASRVLPPEKVAKMLQDSAPAIAQYLLKGGDLPVLKGSAEFATAEVDVVRSLLLDGIWDMLPQKPAFPAFMPFTPEWNLGYGKALTERLWPLRYYANLARPAMWLALSAAVLLSGLLYLVWLKERRPFFHATGALLVVNSLLLFALTAGISYAFRPLADQTAALAPTDALAGLFGPDYPALVRAVLWPFRSIFFVAAMTSGSLGLALFTTAIALPGPGVRPIGKITLPERPARKKLLPERKLKVKG